MVLNEAAKLLGIALRETEDTLTRNMLMGTATAINAEGGQNGDNPRFCGVVKSFLIDLETRWGNKGQAQAA